MTREIVCQAMVAPSSAVEAHVAVPSVAVRRVAFILMLASGFAGLAYEIVWTQQSALWLGHESAAVFAVTAAFFGGLAAGSLILGPRIDRSGAPGLWYAAAEAVIALWSLALAVFFAPVTAWLLHVIGATPSPVWHWFVAFAGVFLLLLPATAAMGATLPAMERILGRMREDGTSISGIYAFNTLGAVLGVVGAAFVLVPGVGLVRTAAVCAVLNLLCAGVALKCFGRGATRCSPDARQPLDREAPARQAPADRAAADRAPADRASADRASAHRAAAHSAAAYRVTAHGGLAHEVRGSRASALLAITGLLGIGYEILVVRVLSQVAENTVYTFSILLAVYLVGTAVGAAACHRWLSSSPNDDSGRATKSARDGLLLLVAGACLLGLVGLEFGESIKEWAPTLFSEGAHASAHMGAGSSASAGASAGAVVELGERLGVDGGLSGGIAWSGSRLGCVSFRSSPCARRISATYDRDGRAVQLSRDRSAGRRRQLRTGAWRQHAGRRRRAASVRSRAGACDGPQARDNPESPSVISR